MMPNPFPASVTLARLTEQAAEGPWFRLHADPPFLLTSTDAGDMGPSGRPHPLRRARVLSSMLSAYAMCDLSSADVASVSQVHGRHIVNIDGGEYPPSTDADGIICTGDRVASMITVADCLPIALWARGGELRALVHSGWKGTGIVADALDVMARAHGVAPADVYMCIGPGISTDAYEVDAARARLFADRFGDRAVPTERHLDLRRANVDLALRYGVKHITVYEDCTVTHAGLSSFRAEGPDRYRRMAAVLLPPRKI